VVGDEDDNPHEPDEYDPEADLPDPENDLVSTPSIPEPPEAPEVMPASEAPDYVRNYFWKAVLVANYARFGVTVGPMLLFFEADYYRGGILFVTGAAAFGYLAVVVRRFRERSAEERAKAENDDGAPDEDDEGAADGAEGVDATSTDDADAPDDAPSTTDA
jgi:hypothetical protein